MTNRKSAIIISLIFVILFMAGCKKQPETKIEKSDSIKDLSAESYTIAIAQYADHEAMNQCENGFLEELKTAGVVEGDNLTVSFQSAGADKERAKLIANSCSTMEPDLIYCIGSKSASVMLSEVHTQSIPIVFSAVTNPISSEISDTDGEQKEEITGVYTPFRPEKQIQLVQNILPNAKRIGIIYSSGEENSISSVEQYRSLAQKSGLVLSVQSVKSSHDINSAIDRLIGKVDCIVNVPDSLVSSHLSVVLDKAMENNIPVFGCDEYQVQEGCIASQGINYFTVGKEAGQLAIDVLSGENKASQLPFIQYDSSQLYLNSETADQLGIEITDTLKDEAENIYDRIEEGEK